MIRQTATDTRLRPLEAVKAVRRLLANPEATDEVFHILGALRGRSDERPFHRFRGSAMGRRILAERRNLFATLSDRTILAALPPGSLGARYHRFMASENLSADGLVAPSQAYRDGAVSADMALFRDRLRDSHDLSHVLTGYGRDPLGELCLLAFTYPHTGNAGMALIVLMGLVKIDSWAARRAVLQAWWHGRKARCWLGDMDWEALLPQPLALVRRRFNILAPSAYRAVTA